MFLFSLIITMSVSKIEIVIKREGMIHLFHAVLYERPALQTVIGLLQFLRCQNYSRPIVRG